MEVLNRMCFIKAKPLNDDESNKEKDTLKDLCSKIWDILEDKSNKGVYPENLKIFTGSIMKIIMVPEAKSQVGRYGRIDEKGKFTLTQKQAATINKDFNVLYLNRTTYNAPVVKSVEEAECTFKPSLCDLSVSIATRGFNSSRLQSKEVQEE